MEVHFAPLQGYSDNLYRRFHAEVYGAADCYYTPFVRIEHGEIRRQDLARLKASKEDKTSVVPQIIFNSADEFSRLSAEIKDIGFDRIDLNLGCPFTMQTAKGRGAALLKSEAVVSLVCALINDDSECAYSVKMRLGIDDAGQWQQIMPILNYTRLTHITIHPRIARQMYQGEVDIVQFEEAYSQSRVPIIFNGDIHSVADIQRITAEHPNLKGVMIGRGFLARPSLYVEWLSGAEWGREERIARLLKFHNLLFDAYQSTLCGPTQILQKIKPFWDYLESEIGHKAAKAIKKSTTIPKYQAAVAQI